MPNMLRSNCKPPLARSPIRLRSRRVLQPTANTLQTPPGSLTKSQKPNRVAMDVEETDLRPEYQTISYELRALAKMVQNEFGNEKMGEVAASAFNSQRSPLFERGRFYEEYAARRNERLRRRKGEKAEEKKTVYDLGVRVESVKRRGEAKKYESGRKSAAVVPSTPVIERREAPVPPTTSRYMLRSTTSKENKKPPMVSSTPSAATGRTGARRARRI